MKLRWENYNTILVLKRNLFSTKGITIYNKFGFFYRIKRFLMTRDITYKIITVILNIRNGMR